MSKEKQTVAEMYKDHRYKKECPFCHSICESFIGGNLFCRCNAKYYLQNSISQYEKIREQSLFFLKYNEYITYDKNGEEIDNNSSEIFSNNSNCSPCSLQCFNKYTLLSLNTIFVGITFRHSLHKLFVYS